MESPRDSKVGLRGDDSESKKKNSHDEARGSPKKTRVRPQYLQFVPRLAALNHTLPAALVRLIDFWMRSLELYYLRLVEAHKWRQEAQDLIKKVTPHCINSFTNNAQVYSINKTYGPLA